MSYKPIDDGNSESETLTQDSSERFRANVTAMVIKFCDGLLDRNGQLEVRIAELESLARQQDRRIDELMTDEALAQARIAELETALRNFRGVRVTEYPKRLTTL